jgi:DNA-binding PadR family transcriptional regulator
VRGDGPGHGEGRRGGHRGGGGRRGGGGGGGRRSGGRGDVRAAILALLAERPMHGYEMLQEIARRTKDLWRPSPGSLYPALQLLEDQQLVRSSSTEGRRRFELTGQGRAELTLRPAGRAPWDAMLEAADPNDLALDAALRHLGTTVRQVAEAGTPAQKAQVEQILCETRRRVYLLLAEAPDDGR